MAVHWKKLGEVYEKIKIYTGRLPRKGDTWAIF